jgi:hypothetical protein
MRLIVKSTIEYASPASMNRDSYVGLLLLKLLKMLLLVVLLLLINVLITLFLTLNRLSSRMAPPLQEMLL